MPNVISRTCFALTIVGLSFALSACGYNTIPTLQEQAKARWSDVQNQYQRRADLIPNLVSTVQGYAAQEKSVLTGVVEARAKATQIKVDASDLTDPDKIKAFQDAQAQLTGALGRLLAVSENYPDSNPMPISWHCNRSSKAPRIALRWRGAIISTQYARLTRRCERSQPSSGQRRHSPVKNRWRNSRRTKGRKPRRR
jgi:LemA protein